MRTIMLVALLLAACATPEERAANAVAKFGAYCDKSGLDRATDAWRSCIQHQEAADNSARRAAAQDAAAERPRTCQVVQPGNVVTCF